MNSLLISWLRGYVKAEVQGKRPVDFINMAVDRHFELWDIQRNNKEVYTMFILIHDFIRLRPLLKQSGSKIRVIKRLGLPFMLDKLWHRKYFAAGVLLFLASLYLLSSVIWKVSITGNEMISNQEIREAAKNLGVHPYQWKFRLSSPDKLSNGLMAALPGAAWVGFEIKGSQAYIQVVENNKPKHSVLKNPRNLIATKDAVITHMLVDKGKPMVKINSRVKKGDILVSGVLGDEVHQQVVVAEGMVRGLVWHEYEISVPELLQYKEYTGAAKDLQYFVVGNWALLINGYGKPDFEKFETEDHRLTLRWKDFSLHIGWLTEKVREVHYNKRKLNLHEAKNLGLRQAKTDIMRKSGNSAKIVKEIILQVKSGSGKVHMKVLFEVDEEITMEQPIIPNIQGE